MRKELVPDYLPQLNDAVAQLITWPPIHSLVDNLKKELQHTSEPFVWSTIDMGVQRSASRRNKISLDLCA
jgi:hypothetical protein